MLESRPTDGLPGGQSDGPEAPDAVRLEFRVPATNAGARKAIVQLLALVEKSGARKEDVDRLEIALAEVLNNIVEHAYSDTGEGMIELAAEARDPGLHLTIWDEGVAMPAGRLPGGAPADPELDPHEQAEGGYGLFMIRQLARKLRYERAGDRNRLSFRIPLSRG